MRQTPKRVSINPDNILQNALALYKVQSFDCTVPLQVEFEGEPAVDLGGVRSQFFSSLIKEMATSPHAFAAL